MISRTLKINDKFEHKTAKTISRLWLLTIILHRKLCNANEQCLLFTTCPQYVYTRVNYYVHLPYILLNIFYSCDFVGSKALFIIFLRFFFTRFPWGSRGQQLRIMPPHISIQQHRLHFAWIKIQMFQPSFFKISKSLSLLMFQTQLYFALSSVVATALVYFTQNTS